MPAASTTAAIECFGGLVNEVVVARDRPDRRMGAAAVLAVLAGERERVDGEALAVGADTVLGEAADEALEVRRRSDRGPPDRLVHRAHHGEAKELAAGKEQQPLAAIRRRHEAARVQVGELRAIVEVHVGRFDETAVAPHRAAPSAMLA